MSRLCTVAAVSCLTGLVASLGGCTQKPDAAGGRDPGAAKEPRALSMRPTPERPTPERSAPWPRPSERDDGLRSPNWPAGYVQRKVVALPPARVVKIGTVLGGELRGVNNYYLRVGKHQLQVNIMEAVDAAAAKRVLATLLQSSGTAWQRYGRRGTFVVEVLGGVPLLWHSVLRNLGLLDRESRRYRLTARFGLLQAGDAADVNLVFNLLLRPKPDDAIWKKQLSKLLGGLRFGSTLTLRTTRTEVGRPYFRLTPAPVRSQEVGRATRYELGPVKQLHGVPYVDVVAMVATRGWTPLVVGKPAGGAALTAATAAWPARASRVQKLVRKLVHGTPSPRARLVLLHRWVHRNIRHAGRQGSRDGPLAVLARGFGRCGDSADLLITLARAAGLPARLVAGWVVGLSGHFWAEVHIPYKGWVTVDATVPWLGAPAEYIPLMISEEGPLPLMHLRLPKIERLR